MKTQIKTGMILAMAAWMWSCSDDAKSTARDNALTDVTHDGAPQDSGGGTGTPDSDASGVVRFPGTGISGSGDALKPGIPPETADECNANTVTVTPSEVIAEEVECFYGKDNPDIPAAAIEQIVEVVADKEWVHLRLTLDPAFVDNSYGATAIGWGNDEIDEKVDEDSDEKKPPKKDEKKGTHTFKDLVGSDHAEMLLYAADDTLALHFKLDYISLDAGSASGYSTLGVNGGDGQMIVGDASAILGVSTSLNRNLNGCGLLYVEDSPATTSGYALLAGAENWDFRVVYEVWVDNAAFGSAGFGRAIIENVHASPAKQKENTIEVVPGDCPCDPEVEDCDPWEELCDPAVENCDTGMDTDTQQITNPPVDSDTTDTDSNPLLE
ncbi:MAG: hypothetical protein JXR76_24495 [Deltaproteobacteria bacterium]|nr:hypothetical protein [Deltaproteobacteria bacterium]